MRVVLGVVSMCGVCGVCGGCGGCGVCGVCGVCWVKWLGRGSFDAMGCRGEGVVMVWVTWVCVERVLC